MAGTQAASKLNEAPPTMTDTAPVANNEGTGTQMQTTGNAPTARGNAVGTDASIPIVTEANKANESDTVTGPTIDLTEHDAAMVKLFERLGALKGAASFIVLDQSIDSLAAIHDLDDGDDDVI